MIYDNNGLYFYVTGVNHFNQRVIFLDFEDQCQNALSLYIDEAIKNEKERV